MKEREVERKKQKAVDFARMTEGKVIEEWRVVLCDNSCNYMIHFNFAVHLTFH